MGLSIGGRVSDRRPHLALLTGASATVLLSIVMPAAIHKVWAVVPTVLLLGIAAFVLNPALYGRVFTIAAAAPTLAGATTVSAFQLGISITPVLAAVSLTQGAALTSVCLIGGRPRGGRGACHPPRPGTTAPLNAPRGRPESQPAHTPWPRGRGSWSAIDEPCEDAA